MSRFPNNKKFAFTILDDTDLSTVGNVAPVYRLLSELGMRTTKSVWPLASVREGRQGGCSLQDADYLKFILELAKEPWVRNFVAQCAQSSLDARDDQTGAGGISGPYRLLSTCSYQSVHKMRQHLLGSGSLHQTAPPVQSRDGVAGRT